MNTVSPHGRTSPRSPQLNVDPDAPLSFAAVPVGFQSVAGARQIAKLGRRVELVELARGGAREAGEGPDPAAPVEVVRFLVGEANDHRACDSATTTVSTVDAVFALRQAQCWRSPEYDPHALRSCSAVPPTALAGAGVRLSAIRLPARRPGRCSRWRYGFSARGRRRSSRLRRARTGPWKPTLRPGAAASSPPG